MDKCVSFERFCLWKFSPSSEPSFGRKFSCDAYSSTPASKLAGNPGSGSAYPSTVKCSSLMSAAPAPGSAAGGDSSKYRMVPRRIVHAKADEPAEQQVNLQLFDQLLPVNRRR